MDYELYELSQQLGQLLASQKKIITTAESCTGGWIAQVITEVAGSSAWYDRGFITYSNESKIKMLGVKHTTLETYGAVSSQTVAEMADGALINSNADCAIAVTGIAGPTGGTDEKPVGTVWIAVSSKEKTLASKFIFGDDRQRNIVMTSQTALNLLRKLVLKDE